jgi:hypothetical protein
MICCAVVIRVTIPPTLLHIWVQAPFLLLRRTCQACQSPDEVRPAGTGGTAFSCMHACMLRAIDKDLCYRYLSLDTVGGFGHSNTGDILGSICNAAEMLSNVALRKTNLDHVGFDLDQNCVEGC